MNSIPIIDNTFDLGKALQEDGFKIDYKENSTVAYGLSYGNYGQIWIGFDMAFLDNNHSHMIDMHVFHFVDGVQENLYKGLAPTNQQDYDTLMQLLFPSEEYVTMIESNINEQSTMNALSENLPQN